MTDLAAHIANDAVHASSEELPSGGVEITSVFSTASTTGADVTGSVMTLTQPHPAKPLRVHLSGWVATGASNSLIYVDVYVDGVWTERFGMSLLAGRARSISKGRLLRIASGTHTWKLALVSQFGTVSIAGSAGFPFLFQVCEA